VLPRIHPMRLKPVKEPFDHDDYVFELKHDGFRAVAYFQHGECKLISRNMNRLRFDSLKSALAQIPVENAIIDGEIVCLDDRGVSQFNWLLDRKHEPVFYAFDLLWHNGADLRPLPLIERKTELSLLVQKSHRPRLLYAQHIDGAGKQFFQEICRRDLEGIVGKRKMSVYKDDGLGWVKIKNRNYSQAEGRQELLTKKRSS
jgi:bifunctional non-homologous end joining protein LigD